MAEFTLFSGFAPEIRRMIWRHALEEESSSRMVLVHRTSLRIMPSKSLISSIMHVSQESRDCAQEFYNLQVDIYALPPLNNAPVMEGFEEFIRQEYPDGDRDHELQDRENREYFWCNEGQAATYDAANDILRQGPDLTTDQFQGTIFLSTDWDRFAVSFHFWLGEEDLFDVCDVHLALDTQRQFLGPNSSPTWTAEHHDQQRHHVSVPLSPQVCHTVRKVAATFDGQSPSGSGYSRHYYDIDANMRWRRGIFDAIETHLRLRADSKESFIDAFFAGEYDKFDIEELELMDEDAREDGILLRSKKAERQHPIKWIIIHE